VDGDIDYSKYSRQQLTEVREHIDALRYPRNFENLQRELENRPPEQPPPEVPYRVPLRSIYIWSAAWVAALFGPIAISTSTGDASLIWVGMTGLVAWSTYLGFQCREEGDTLGFVLEAGVPLVLLAASGALCIALELAR